MKWKVKVSSPVNIFKATKSIIFHFWCCFQYSGQFTLIQVLLQNLVVDIGVDSVIDIDVGIDDEIDRDIDVYVFLSD